MGRPKDEILLDLIDAAGPVCRRGDLAGIGLTRATYHRLLKGGELVRLTGAAFTTARRWEATTGWDRFRLRARAVGRTGPDDLYLAGWGAAVEHDLPVFGSPPALPMGLKSGDPHVGAQRTPYFRYRRGWLPEHRRLERDGVRLIDEALCAVDVARQFGRQAGLVVADRVVARGTSTEELTVVCENLRQYPGVTDALWCATHASARSESPAESLGRWAFLHQGREAPLANVWFWRGRLQYRADLYLPEQRVILEADGAIKYDNRSDASRVVRDQVKREEHLRSWNLGLVRFGHWDPVNDPAELVSRADRAAILRPDEPLLCNWSVDPPWLRRGPAR